MQAVKAIRVTAAGQTTLPIGWRRRQGLVSGGPLKVVELADGQGSLLLTPIRPPQPAGKGVGLGLLAMPPGLPDIPKHYLPFK
jgi:bifunctional DNA-binding transcriptional regulator/antitoxin component of YhaV-PrlF toxin-antitoxin module